MARRPARLRAFTGAFDVASHDTGSLRALARPLPYAPGGRSDLDLYPRMGERLGSVFDDLRIDRYDDRHHPTHHRAEPVRVAKALPAKWADAETMGQGG